MNSRFRLTMTSVLFFVACANTQVVGGDDGSAKVAFDKIKSLAGDWYDAGDKESLVSQVRAVSGGSAVMETLFPGSDKEMISIYHLDGDQLVMTHYCMLGNQPKFNTVLSENTIKFEFAGGSNMNPTTDLHIHAGVIEFVEADRIRSKWTPFENGKPLDAHEFELVRRKK